MRSLGRRHDGDDANPETPTIMGNWKNFSDHEKKTSFPESS
jgi:hypothetical protein